MLAVEFVDAEGGLALVLRLALLDVDRHGLRLGRCVQLEDAHVDAAPGEVDGEAIAGDQELDLSAVGDGNPGALELFQIGGLDSNNGFIPAVFGKARRRLLLMAFARGRGGPCSG